jgi:hypothetical protein
MICLHCEIEILPPKRKFCCKEHKNSYNHKHLYNHKYTKTHRSKNPENFIKHLMSYKKRRESISLDDVMSVYNKQEGLCALSGVEMTYNQFGGKCPSNISIDRIDSSKGYRADNIQLVCSLVNTMKMQYTKEELVFWCKKIVENNE